MTRFARSTSRHRGQPGGGVSLFPFLAVLICTMGALILVLVVLARQARLQAAQAVAAETAEVQHDLQAEHEMIQWRASQLRAARAKTESQLAEARLRLGHVEDHARQLRDQLVRLDAALAEQHQAGAPDGPRRAELEAELARLRAAASEAERQLAEAQDAAGQTQRCYAVVPYQGARGTRRRPIYIECGPRAVTLQPEGIVLAEEDFEGPMGPSNPLAAALRAAREYLLARGGLGPDGAAEPYPLLLVRPDGIGAYYAARAAMKSWGSEFGYELIAGDWQLAFQPPDPNLAETLRRAVDTARVRQERLMAAAPRQYGQRPKPTYRVAPTRGGIVLESGAESGDGGNDGGGGFAGGSSADRPLEGPVFAPPAERQAADRQGAPSRPGEWQPRQEDSSGQPADGPPPAQVQSLAAKRGRDWGLPDADRGSLPITRPIRVECHADRLVILPERGQAAGKAIPLGGRTEASIDQLISAVWEHIDGWGIAGRGMYWRPILQVGVAAGAEQRFAELGALLDGSGLGVERQ